MSTPAITASLPPLGTDVSKTTSRDNNGNSPFNDILNKEIADRNPPAAQAAQTADASSAGKKEEAGNANSAEASNETAATPGTESDNTDIEVSAEQILMVATPFIPAALDPQASMANADASTTLSDTAARLLSRVSVASATTDTASLDPNTLTGLLTDASKDKTDGHQNPMATLANDKLMQDGAKNGNATVARPLAATPQGMTENAAISAVALSTQEVNVEALSEGQTEFATTLNALQQAAATVAQNAASAAERIAPRVGTSAWNHAIGQKIVWMVGSEQQSASLTLNPPDLGPMQVVLNVSSTQATASFYSPHAEVREALEAALPRLREMLGDAGIQLGQANVNAGTPQQHDGFTPTFAASRQADGSGHDDLHMTQPLPAPRMVREGLIDTFA